MPSSASPLSHFYTLSLHDALPICVPHSAFTAVRGRFWFYSPGNCASGWQRPARMVLLTLWRIVTPVRDTFRHHSLMTRSAHSTSSRSEEHTSELQSRFDLVCRLLLPLSPTSTLFPYTTLFRSVFLTPHLQPSEVASGFIRPVIAPAAGSARPGWSSSRCGESSRPFATLSGIIR